MTDWSNKKVISLIELYKENACLWNPKDANFKNNEVKNEIWTEIGEKMECNVLDVKKKIESLCASFRRERLRMKTISATDKDYQPKWFAYKHLSFLSSKAVRRPNRSTMVTPKTEYHCLEDLPEASIIFEEIANDPDNQPQEEIEEDTIAQEHSPKYLPRIKYRRRASEDPYIVYKRPSLERKRDGSDIFGEHIALKHRSYSERTRCIVEHLISNILFKADMGQYDNASTIEYAEEVTL